MADMDNFMKNIKQNAKNTDEPELDIDDELAALEAEVTGKPKQKAGKKKSAKKKKDDDDLDLSDLSDDDGKPSKGKDCNDDLAGLDSDEDKKKPSQEIESKPKVEAPKPKKEVVDIYSLSTETIYHNCDKMKSINVLEAEKEICDKIIQYKKSNGIDDYDMWESKKDIIEVNSNRIQNFIENGILDLEGYKKTLEDQMKYEKQLIELTKKDKKLPPHEAPELLNRINARMKLIETELSENIDEEPEEEVKVEEPTVSIDIKEDKSNKEIEKKPIEKQSITNKAVNEKLLAIIKERYNEYKEAYDYFKENQCNEQMQKTVLLIKEIILAQKEVEAGNDKNIDEFTIPMTVTPDYICGYDNKTRITKYRELCSELIKQKQEAVNYLQKLQEAFKSLKSSELKKVMESAKKDVEAKKAKIEKLDKLINIFKENAKDQWMPAPIIDKVDEEEKVEVINTEIAENKMVIEFGKTDLNVGKIYLYLVFNYSDKTLNQYVYLKTKDDFNEKIEWSFEKNEFKHLWRKDLEIQVYSKGIFSSKVIGTLKLKLSDLKEKSEKKGTFDIDMVDKKKGIKAPILDVSIRLRIPCFEKEYKIKYNPVFNVTKIYPSFKKDGNKDSISISLTTNDKPEEKSKPQGQQQKPQAEKRPPKQSSQIQAQLQSQAKPSKPNEQLAQNTNKPKISKSLFSEEELQNPDHIDNLNSVEVLTLKEGELTAQIQKIEGRTPRPLREQLTKIRCKKKVLEEQLGEGAITPQSYLEILKKQLQHDKQLNDYFEQESEKEKASITQARFKLLFKEINELMDYIKQNPE